MTEPGADTLVDLLDDAGALSRRFPVWLCDVWGVVHDGVTSSRLACDALMRHRNSGGTVILITNAPRPGSAILPQLESMKVSPDCYDAIVSSGDVTRSLVARWAGKNVYHLGPDKDLALLEGLPVTFTGLDEADVMLCSGLIDDDNEDPEDYRDLLMRTKSLGLDMICANPDKVVRKGKALLPCAGALADIYAELGGKVEMAGKPYPPIYDECLRHVADKRGAMPAREDVLAIGDGLSTDVKGAAHNGINILFIVTGIHEHELDGVDTSALVKRVHDAAPGVRIAGVMTGLR